MNVQRNLPSKKKFKIGDIADVLDVKKFILRTWEKEFDLDKGGTGIYSESDIALFKKIKDLLFFQKMSVREAKASMAELLAQREVAAAANAAARVAVVKEESSSQDVFPAVQEDSLACSAQVAQAVPLVSCAAVDAESAHDVFPAMQSEDVAVAAAPELCAQEAQVPAQDLFPAMQSGESSLDDYAQKISCTGQDCEKTQLMLRRMEEFKRQVMEIRNMLGE